MSAYQPPLSSPSGYPPLGIGQKGWRRTRIAFIALIVAILAGAAVSYASTSPIGFVKRDVPTTVNVSVGVVGDVDGDGLVTLSDLELVAQAINTGIGAQRTDLNGDGVVDVLDLVIAGTSFEGP